MTVESLGMIEVKGFLGAVVVADAALKAAEVDLRDLRITRGGLVTVLLTGDVAAVNAGVDAGIASIDQFDCLISEHVIARMDGQTNAMVQSPTPELKKVVMSKFPESKQEIDNINSPKTEASHDSDSLVESHVAIESVDSQENWVTDRGALEQMRVVDLRKQAYRMNIQTLTKKQIKMGTKRTLVQAILDDLQRRNES
ncbi:BMC domain-containing protein [Levilactobacillus brevis]|uniref:BMC domain-containing protein n=1 Tax=Levilactobacillus brevis TaxID=1580 RepID=UPI001BDE3506|nr:BMC domain-containing protein [Levilactobacillus brevis]